MSLDDIQPKRCFTVRSWRVGGPNKHELIVLNHMAWKKTMFAKRIASCFDVAFAFVGSSKQFSTMILATRTTTGVIWLCLGLARRNPGLVFVFYIEEGSREASLLPANSKLSLSYLACTALATLL